MTESVERRTALPIEEQDATQRRLSIEALSTQNLSLEALKDITFGSVSRLGYTLKYSTDLRKIAGIIGKTIEYPFDTVKVRLQSQPHSFPLRYNGPLDCFHQSFRTGGITGLYRGISAPLVGAAIETSSLFFSYRIAQNALQATLYSSDRKETLPLGALIACGGASGAFTSLLLTPIELVKCQMQIPVSGISHQLAGPLSVIGAVYRHHGVFGFWHGQLGTLIRETGGSAAWFGSYESVSTLLRNYVHKPDTDSSNMSMTQKSLPVWQQMLAGAAAGISYNFIFYPADTIKSRMQTEEISEVLQGRRKTFWEVGKALWQQQGVKGLYRGCGITVGRAAPSSAFIFAVYEGLRKWAG